MSVDERYFKWLYGQVGTLSNRNTMRSFSLLAEQLHKKTFRAYVRNDDNRICDGLDLRYEFCNIYGVPESRLVHLEPCSMLEMLVALARRMAYESDGLGRGYDLGDWFWRILNNVGLRSYNDDVYLNDRYSDVQDSVDVILDNIIERRYSKDGSGGLFPLENPDQDQRKVELWYQMSAYILEKTDIGY